jgi:chromosome segregation ATPase
MPPSKATSHTERIYSPHQLNDALKSGIVHIREQLGVLVILDGTAAAWPGVNQAVEDLSFLVEASGATNNRLEDEVAQAQAQARNAEDEAQSLKDSLASLKKSHDELKKENNANMRDNRSLRSELDTANKEVSQQKSEIWSLEKAKGDLESELDKYKQDQEYMEGEINGLRNTLTEQMQLIGTLKEDLAARKADIGHLNKAVSSSKAHATDLQKQNAQLTANLQKTQQAQDVTRRDAIHNESEAKKNAEEVAKLTKELNKTSTELQRAKDWSSVVAKVEADKLREAQSAHHKQELLWQGQRSELEMTIANLNSQLAAKEEACGSKVAEIDSTKKQLAAATADLKTTKSQLTTTQNEKAAALKELGLATAEVSKLKERVQAITASAAKADKAHLLELGKLKEAQAKEIGNLKTALEETRKEGAVHKALSDGWSRDLRNLTERLEQELQRSMTMKQTLDELTRVKDGNEDAKYQVRIHHYMLGEPMAPFSNRPEFLALFSALLITGDSSSLPLFLPAGEVGSRAFRASLEPPDLLLELGLRGAEGLYCWGG